MFLSKLQNVFVLIAKCISTHLIAPPLHLDALPIVTSELPLLLAAGQLQHRCVSFSFVAIVIVVRDRPLVLAEDVRGLAGFRHSVHIILSIRQRPLAACVVVLNSRRRSAQQDHVAGIVGQLLWGEKGVDQRRSTTAT